MKLSRLFIILPGILSILLLNSCEDILGDLNGRLSQDMLVDTWKVEENTGSYKSAEEVYWVEIEAHPSDTGRIVIYNFYNVEAEAEAILAGGMELIIPEQVLEGGYTVTGRGEAQGNRANQIIWTYTVDDGSGIPENITAIYTRLTF